MSTTKEFVFLLSLFLSCTNIYLQFVYPRINPIRKDVAVMTHQSEIVNVWED